MKPNRALEVAGLPTPASFAVVHPPRRFPKPTIGRPRGVSISLAGTPPQALARTHTRTNHTSHTGNSRQLWASAPHFLASLSFRFLAAASRAAMRAASRATMLRVAQKAAQHSAQVRSEET